MDRVLNPECAWMGLMGRCKQRFYLYRDEDNILCYYHKKVSDGLLEQEEEGGYLLELT